MQDWADAGHKRCRLQRTQDILLRMQVMKDTRQDGCSKGRMQDRMVARQIEFRKEQVTTEEGGQSMDKRLDRMNAIRY